MSENTVATTTTVTTGTPEGFVSLKRIAEVAEAAKAKHGYCDDIDNLMLKEFGIDLMQVGQKVRFTMDIPAVAMDSYSGRTFWLGEESGELRTEEYEYSVSNVLYAAISAISLLREQATNYRNSGKRDSAQKALQGVKLELINGEALVVVTK